MSEQTQTTYPYVYLDSEQDRKQLITKIKEVRREVLALIDAMQDTDYYEPRYHGWSLAATIAHLNMSDSLGMLLIRAALVGIPVRVSAQQNDSINDFMAKVFKRRLVTTSRQSVEKNQKRIADLILTLPMDRFSRTVYMPGQGDLTIEKALQYLYLFHWQHHLNIMREVEGIQPPESRDSA